MLPWSHRGFQNGAETFQQGGWRGSTAITHNRQELTVLPSHFLREFVRESSLLLETSIAFDGKMTVKKTSTEAGVTLEGIFSGCSGHGAPDVLLWGTNQ